MAKVYQNSMAERAGFTEVQNRAGEVILKFQSPLPALTQVDYGDNREYTVNPGDTWQNISLRFLGAAELWWIIAEFNRVLDPFEELWPGRRLIIPSATRIRLSSLEQL